MKQSTFEALARRAFAALPDELLRPLENVVVLVEEWPPADVLDELGIDDPLDLLGLYQGHSLPEQSVDLWGNLPDQVVLYQRPTEQYARDTGEPIEQVIWDTLVHEIGHHLGYDEEALEALEGRR